MCTPRVSERAPSDALRACADAVWALEQPTASLADQYVANTGPVEPTSNGAIWTTHDSLRSQNRRKPISETQHAHLSPTGYTAPYGPIRLQQSSKKCTKPAARLSTQSDQGFRYALNWQTRTQNFFILTAESNQTELGARAISVCRAHWFTYHSCYVFSIQ